jgi:peptidoglycan/LPS O-acetylase OafA/YrhL
VFWTIHCELWGSFGVYAFWLLAGGRKWRWLLYPAALALWRGNAYQAFVFGVLLADCAPAFAKWAESGRHAWASTLLVVLGVMFGGYAEADELRGGYERALQGLLPDLRGVFCSGCRLIGAVLLMAGVLGGIWWQRVLSGSWGSHLGRLSYSIYGIHGPIQITLMAPLIAWLHPMADIRTPFVPDGGGYALAVAVALLVYLPAVWFCSALLTVAVDEPCTRLARRFSDGVMGWWKMGR